MAKRWLSAGGFSRLAGATVNAWLNAYCAAPSTRFDEATADELKEGSSPSMMVGWQTGAQVSVVRALPR